MKIFLYKIVLFVVPVLVLFEILFRLGFSPIVTNSMLFDFKMLEARKHHVKNVKLLSVGSSIGLYELNSGVIVKNLKMPYYNFASWGMTIADMRVLLNSLVKEYKPKYVIICSSLGDFMTTPNDSYLNYVSTNSYIRNNFPEFFYFKNYNSIHQLFIRKYEAYHLDFDKWGGASLTIKQKDINRDKWNEHFIFPTAYTQGQYKELDTLGAFLKEQNIGFIFVQAPIKASYTNTPLAEQIVKLHFDKCKSIVGNQGGIYLNYYNTTVFTDSLFFDQSHLQAEGSVILTQEIVADLKTIIK